MATGAQDRKTILEALSQIVQEHLRARFEPFEGGSGHVYHTINVSGNARAIIGNVYGTSNPLGTDTEQKECFDQQSGSLDDHKQLLQSRLQKTKPDTPYDTINDHTLSVETRLYTEQCEPFCPCECHRMVLWRNPAWTNGILGTFVLHTNASAFLKRRTCSHGACGRGGGSSARFTLSFPKWVFSRILNFKAYSQSLQSKPFRH